jgi:RES domain-containing protein
LTVSIWRIATDTPDYTADDLQGSGARLTGGRWNRPGTPLVYCSMTIALACLETFVHVKATGLPLNRYLVRIDVPEGTWSSRQVPQPLVGWDALPTGKVSLDMGEHWVASGASALLVVPSVIVPEENNILINPAHTDASYITATKIRKWTYDSRMR